MLGALFYPKGTIENPIRFDSLYIPWIYKEIYFDKVYADIFNKNRDIVVVDVGANIGIVTQFMRNYSKKVYAIEPASEHFEALAKNKDFNCWDNVEVFKLAIADRDGEMTLNKNNKNRTGHSLTTNFKQGKELVETMTMNTFFTKNDINSVDFMKLDVEGAEDLILRSEGFKKVASKIRAIEVEIHFKARYKLVEYMTEIGYQAKRYLKSGTIVLYTR